MKRFILIFVSIAYIGAAKGQDISFPMPPKGTKKALAKSESLIQKPTLPKDMTALQMILHPFGVLKEQIDDYTIEQVERDVRSIFRTNVTAYDHNSVVAIRENNHGYNMTYGGFAPDWNDLYFDEGKVSMFGYQFHFLKSEYSLTVAQNLFEKFLSDLKAENINLDAKNIKGTITNYEGKMGERTIYVSLSEGGKIKEKDSWMVSISVFFFKEQSKKEAISSDCEIVFNEMTINANVALFSKFHCKITIDLINKRIYETEYLSFANYKTAKTMSSSWRYIYFYDENGSNCVTIRDEGTKGGILFIEIPEPELGLEKRYYNYNCDNKEYDNFKKSFNTLWKIVGGS